MEGKSSAAGEPRVGAESRGAVGQVLVARLAVKDERVGIDRDVADAENLEGKLSLGHYATGGDGGDHAELDGSACW